jgi:hypothetical protein
MPVFKETSKNIFPEMSSLNSNNKAFGVCEKNFYSNPIFNQTKQFRPMFVAKDKLSLKSNSPTTSTDSKTLGILQRLQIQKVNSEPQLKKI